MRALALALRVLVETFRGITSTADMLLLLAVTSGTFSRLVPGCVRVPVHQSAGEDVIDRGQDAGLSVVVAAESLEINFGLVSV